MGAENQRPSVLASLRAVEALKPVLARDAGSHVAALALRAGEGPNGWGENRGRYETQANTFTPTLRRSLTSISLRAQIFARVDAGLLRRGARCAPRYRRGEQLIRCGERERDLVQGRVTHPAPGASKLGTSAGLRRFLCEDFERIEENYSKGARPRCAAT
mgnify:CR=1 FL=1